MNLKTIFKPPIIIPGALARSIHIPTKQIFINLKGKINFNLSFTKNGSNIPLKTKYKKNSEDKNILVIEDHSEIGGLAQIVKTLAFESSYSGKIFSFSLKDKFIHCYSNQDELLNKHKVNEKYIIDKIKKTFLK